MKLHMNFFIFLLLMKHPVLWQIWGRKTKEENSTNPFLYHYRCSPNNNATSFGAKCCEKPEKENIECHFTSFWVAPRMATLCITAAHRRWVKFRGSKRRAKTFASSLVKHSGRFFPFFFQNLKISKMWISEWNLEAAKLRYNFISVVSKKWLKNLEAANAALKLLHHRS